MEVLNCILSTSYRNVSKAGAGQEDTTGQPGGAGVGAGCKSCWKGHSQRRHPFVRRTVGVSLSSPTDPSACFHGNGSRSLRLYSSPLRIMALKAPLSWWLSLLCQSLFRLSPRTGGERQTYEDKLWTLALLQTLTRSINLRVNKVKKYLKNSSQNTVYAHSRKWFLYWALLSSIRKQWFCSNTPFLPSRTQPMLSQLTMILITSGAFVIADS